MARAEHTGRNAFIFTWKIENFVHYVHENMSSPTFFAHSIDREFRLELFFQTQQPGESVISFYLQPMHAYCQSIELDFELSFLALDGSPLISKEKFKKRFKDDEGHGFFDFMPLYDVVINRRVEFLPQGTLTLQCKIWKSEGNMCESVLCFARTRLGIEQLSFIWLIERFSALNDSGTSPYSVRTASGEDPLLSMNFQLQRVSSEGKQFELELMPENVHQFTKEKVKGNTRGEVGFYDFELSFVNVFGYEKLVQVIKRLDFHDIHILPVLVCEEILNEENGYLVDDALTLKCLFVFYEGIVSEGIESTAYRSGAISDPCDSNSVVLSHESKSTWISSLNDIQEFLYETQMFCDVKLRTGTETFAAHKSILSAQSQVFQSIFEDKITKDIIHAGSMKEDIFEVFDVNAETLRQMLLYIYTGTVDDNQLENIYQLFAAAIKYKISTLEKKCSLILVENLNIHNACEMLRFADQYNDQNLKLSIRDFILEHGKEVTGTTAWKILEKRNAVLAEEIYRLV